MKITDVDTFIEEFRNGRDIWSRTAIKLAVREIERLQARVQELEQERRWIPVSERLPNSEDGLNFDGTIDVFVYLRVYKKIIEANYYPKMSVWNMPYGWGDETDNITHWTTRLQPPQEGE